MLFELQETASLSLVQTIFSSNDQYVQTAVVQMRIHGGGALRPHVQHFMYIFLRMEGGLF